MFKCFRYYIWYFKQQSKLSKLLNRFEFLEFQIFDLNIKTRKRFERLELWIFFTKNLNFEISKITNIILGIWIFRILDK